MQHLMQDVCRVHVYCFRAISLLQFAACLYVQLVPHGVPTRFLLARSLCRPICPPNPLVGPQVSGELLPTQTSLPAPQLLARPLVHLQLARAGSGITKHASSDWGSNAHCAC